MKQIHSHTVFFLTYFYYFLLFDDSLRKCQCYGGQRKNWEEGQRKLLLAFQALKNTTNYEWHKVNKTLCIIGLFLGRLISFTSSKTD